MDLITYPSDKLTKPSSHVTDFGEEFQDLADELTMKVLASRAAGLAAPQVGVHKRVVAIATPTTVIIAANPRILEQSEETAYEREGCLSFPGLFIPVHRKRSVTVAYQDATGAPVKIVASGVEARAWQHEIDHLDGVLMIDRVSSFARKEALRKYRKKS